MLGFLVRAEYQQGSLHPHWQGPHLVSTLMATMPIQKPGLSKQDYETPPEFIAAVKARLGINSFYIDLAADQHNRKAELWYGEEHDSLLCNWAGLPCQWPNFTWAWLNPPFANIAPWAKKCSESKIKIAFLVPAGVGANWFRDHVDGKALVLLLNGRLSFDGIAPYPKDCILCLYGVTPGYEVWDWRKQCI